MAAPKKSTIRKKPSIEEFIGAGAAAETHASNSKTTQAPPVDKELGSKLVRIPKGMIRAIKRRAIDESEHHNKRISENDLVERAIAQYLATKII